MGKEMEMQEMEKSINFRYIKMMQDNPAPLYRMSDGYEPDPAYVQLCSGVGGKVIAYVSSGDTPMGVLAGSSIRWRISPFFSGKELYAFLRSKEICWLLTDVYRGHEQMWCLDRRDHSDRWRECEACHDDRVETRYLLARNLKLAATHERLVWTLDSLAYESSNRLWRRFQDKLGDLSQADIDRIQNKNPVSYEKYVY